MKERTKRKKATSSVYSNHERRSRGPKKPRPKVKVTHPKESTINSDNITKKSLERTLLFPDPNAQLIVDAELEIYIAQLKSYLKENPHSKLAIVGHSDNADSKIENYKRSETLTSKVRRFFRGAGFKRSLIFTASKGPEEPNVSHNHPDANKLNNRVELFIKDWR